MLQRKIGTFARITVSLLVLGLMACSGGTDSTRGEAGDPFVADGGAGATLSLTILSPLTVSGTARFVVTALDPAGAGLPFITITCNTERGISILNPSSGGVSRGTTGPDGVLSGTIGGLLPGSWIMECRAPNGLGLVARTRIVISGTIPEDFNGFPGASGGDIGGGEVVDQTPTIDDGSGVRITAFSFTDAGGETTTGPLDTEEGPGVCDNGTPADASDDFREPFTSISFGITVTNDTGGTLFIQTVAVVALQSDGAKSTGFLNAAAEIAKGSSSTISGLFSTPAADLMQHPVGDASLTLSSDTSPVTLEVQGVDENGEAFTAAASTTLTFANVNNCAAGSS